MRQFRRLARIGCCRTVCLWRWNGEQLACSGDVVRTGAIGEQAVVTNAVEAAGQHVNEEAADELVVCEGHQLVSFVPFRSIVLPLEGDALIIVCDQSSV